VSNKIHFVIQATLGGIHGWCMGTQGMPGQGPAIEVTHFCFSQCTTACN